MERLRSAAHWGKRRGPGCALAVAWAALAAASPVAAQARLGIVRAVVMACDAWVDRKGLAQSLPVAVGEPVTQGDLDEARRRLALAGIFRSVDLETQPEADGVRVVVRLDRKPIVSRVRIEGYDGVQVKELRWLLDKLSGGRLGDFQKYRLTRTEMRRLVQVREGMLFEPELVEQAERRVLERFHRLGFVHTQVRSRVSERDDTVEVAFQVDPGEPLLIETIVFAGDDCLSAEDRRVMAEPFLDTPRSRDALRGVRTALQRALRAKGYYEARVKTSWVRRTELRGSVKAVLSCGPLHRLSIVGNDRVDAAELLEVVDLERRMIISDSTWRLMARSMEELYQAKGYYEAEVAPEIQLDEAGKRVEFRVSEGRVYRVRKTSFEGNVHATGRELRAEMATRRARLLPWPRRGYAEKVNLEEDEARIEALYRRRGYESARVRIDMVEGDPGELEARVTIKEGLLTVVQAIEPADFPAPLVLAAPLTAAVGTPLLPEALDKDRDAVLAAWRERGHRDARVDVDVERKTTKSAVEARLLWEVVPGPRYIVGPLVVQENVEVRNDLLLREMPFATGDPLRTEALLKGQERIYSLGLFRAANVQEVEPEPAADAPMQEVAAVDAIDESAGADPSEQGATGKRAARGAAQDASGAPRAPARSEGAAPPDVVLPVAIRVTPRAPGRFSYGSGYNTRDGVTGFAELSYDNVAHRARVLRLRGELSLEPPTFAPKQYLGALTYIDPRFSGSPWELQLGVIGERNTQSVSEFSIERGALAGSFSRKLFDRLRAGADLQLELANVFDVDPVPFAERDAESSRTTAVGGYLAFDRRNDGFNPTKGFIESLRLHYAPPGVSTVDFVQIDAEHTHFIPLGDFADFVVSLRAGWVRTFDDPIVPVRRRYFVGGGESVRGFAVNSLGPYDGEGNDVGGDLALVLKTELRVPIAWGFGLVLFVDGGGNYLLRCDADCRRGEADDEDTAVRDAAASAENFRHSAGVGLRYVSPVGPISVDYGIKLDRRTRHLAEGERERESFGEFSVSIGARF